MNGSKLNEHLHNNNKTKLHRNTHKLTPLCVDVCVAFVAACLGVVRAARITDRGSIEKMKHVPLGPLVNRITLSFSVAFIGSLRFGLLVACHRRPLYPPSPASGLVNVARALSC